jgi:hypothetical protein
MQRAAEIDEQLRQQNIARAEPAMLRAAQRQGATLLPEQPRDFGLTRLCDATPDVSLRAGYCVLDSGLLSSATGEVGNAFEVVDPQGKRRFALSLGRAISSARLASRGKTLFLLIPEVALHPIAHRTQCECRAGPVIISMTGYVNLGSAFLLDELPWADIRQIKVPVVDDDIEWKCKMLLVRNEQAPHRARLGDFTDSCRANHF